MERSEAAELRVEALQRDLEIAKAANTLLDEQKQQVGGAGGGPGGVESVRKEVGEWPGGTG